jgi:hypothetical protein
VRGFRERGKHLGERIREINTLSALLYVNPLLPSNWGKVRILGRRLDGVLTTCMK